MILPVKFCERITAMDKILSLLESNGRYTAGQLAAMLGEDAGEINKKIEQYEKDGTIVGYKALIDWDKTDREMICAVIELKVTPQPDRGFDKIAERLVNYPEISGVYLMSGSYDIQLIIEGKSLKEVASFVAMTLAPMEGVASTATSFVLRKYKDKGVIYAAPEVDERGNCPV